jgi:hypothetical protein
LLIYDCLIVDRKPRGLFDGLNQQSKINNQQLIAIADY